MKFLKLSACLGYSLIIFFYNLNATAKSEVYFSPHGGCEKAIVDLISNSTTKIEIAVYSLNNKEILSALSGAKSRGVKMRILTDHIQAAGNAKVTISLVEEKFDIRLHSVGRIMHNKFAIFDDTKVVNGSFNWTNPAENSNEENCLITDDPHLVSKFENQFNEHLWVVNTVEKSQKHLSKIKKKLLNREVASTKEVKD